MGFSEMLHVKVNIVDGQAQAVASGGPSCSDCSKLLGISGIVGMWLLHEKDDEPGEKVLRRYTTREFHELTLKNLSLYPYLPPPLTMPAPSVPSVGDPKKS